LSLLDNVGNRISETDVQSNRIAKPSLKQLANDSRLRHAIVTSSSITFDLTVGIHVGDRSGGMGLQQMTIEIGKSPALACLAECV
jgi:hypothetical protein